MAMMDIHSRLEEQKEAWERRDPAALAAGYADDAVVSSPMFPRAEGRGAIERSFATLFSAFPDWEVTFEDACVTGNRAMQPCLVRATHKGDFMGLPGTGRRVEFQCVLIFDFQDGLIHRERRIYDFTGVLIQAGVLRGKPAV
jgi:steroid delta-isomerase-like uncharacterized protein